MRSIVGSRTRRPFLPMLSRADREAPKLAGLRVGSATRTGWILQMQAGPGVICAIARTPPLSLRCPACPTDCPIVGGLAPQKFRKEVSVQAEARKGASAWRPSARRNHREFAGWTSATCHELQAWLGASTQEERNPGRTRPNTSGCVLISAPLAC